MKKILVSLLALLNLFHSSTPCFANDNHSEYPNTNELEISTTSDEFYDMKSDGLIPDEVISYIERTERNNPQAEISIIVSTSENNRSLSSYTNYRTYGNYELADMLVHVSNAHNMQNVLSGSSSGDFYSTMAFAAAVNSIAYVYPFYSYAVTASLFWEQQHIQPAQVINLTQHRHIVPIVSLHLSNGMEAGRWEYSHTMRL